MVLTKATVLAVVLAAVAVKGLDVLPCDQITTMAPGERVAIQSPNYPQNYDNSFRCQYEITCPTETSTYLEFICPVFELEDSTDCVNDRLIVTSRGFREEKCGTDNPDGTITSTGWTRLTFASNGDVTTKGFRCYIWCRENPATTTTPAVTTTTPVDTTTTPVDTTTTPVDTTTTPVETTTTPVETTTTPVDTTTTPVDTTTTPVETTTTPVETTTTPVETTTTPAETTTTPVETTTTPIETTTTPVETTTTPVETTTTPVETTTTPVETTTTPEDTTTTPADTTSTTVIC